MKKLIIALICALALSTPALAQDLTFEGGWYAYACPNGEYAALVTDKHVETNAGRVQLPGNQNTLMINHACDGTGRFAGVGGIDDLAYEREASAWHTRGVAFAINPVVYQLGTLVVIHGPGPTGSQGWRYSTNEGALVSGDSTYVCPFGPHLWECTQRGDVVCGQGGDEEGLQCLLGAVQRRVRVAAGITRAVRFTWDGGVKYAFGWVQQDRKQARLRWFTRAELDALPTYTPPGTIPTDPVDPPPPPPPPPPTCTDTTALDRRLLEVLTIHRARYPRPLPTDVEAAKLAKGGILNDTAWQLTQEGFTVGLETKGGDNTAIQPGTGVTVGNDILQTVEAGVRCGRDVLGATGPGEDATPGLGTKGPASADRFVPAVRPGGTTDPTPDPEPDPTVGDLKRRVAELEDRVADLTRDLATAESALDQERQAAEEAERARDQARAEADAARKALEAVTCTSRVNGPGWVRSLFGISATCEVVR